jgi:hypothetical protein
MSCNTLKVKENAKGGKFPAYSKPHVIGHYSVDCDRNYCADLSQLKYIHLPTDYNVKFNLDRGRKLAQKKDDSYDEKLNNLLRWILQNSNGGDWYVLRSSVAKFLKGVFGMKNLSKICLDTLLIHSKAVFGIKNLFILCLFTQNLHEE